MTSRPMGNLMVHCLANCMEENDDVAAVGVGEGNAKVPPPPRGDVDLECAAVVGPAGKGDSPGAGW
jgi:hypothetical protein